MEERDIEDPDALEVEEYGRDQVKEFVALLGEVVVTEGSQDQYAPEQISYLASAESFRRFSKLVEENDYPGAAKHARDLYEANARWAWVDEDRSVRRHAFVNHALKQYESLRSARENLGVETDVLFGPQLQVLLALPSTATRFPGTTKDLFGWMGDKTFGYSLFQYLSDFAHGSWLVSSSVPMQGRLMILRHGLSGISQVVEYCQVGLGTRSNAPVGSLAGELNERAMNFAMLSQPFAPASE